jgi:hypothetical protein
MTDAACVANTPRTGGNAMGSSNACSVGGAGMTGGSESSSASSSAGGIHSWAPMVKKTLIGSIPLID